MTAFLLPATRPRTQQSARWAKMPLEMGEPDQRFVY